jgi:hypothetical protein
MSQSEPDMWVITEVNASDGPTPEFFFAPRTLHIPAGWFGNIIWYVYTPGWQLSMSETEPGISFQGSNFNGVVQPDPTRANCWRAAVANEGTGTFNYTVTVHREGDPSTKFYSSDPVVENDPPPPTT